MTHKQAKGISNKAPNRTISSTPPGAEEEILEEEEEAEGVEPPMVSNEHSSARSMARVLTTERHGAPKLSKRGKEWSRRNRELRAKL